MDTYASGNYSQFTEFMQYFHFVFQGYYVMLAIQTLLLFRLICAAVHRAPNVQRGLATLDVICSALCSYGAALGMVVMGVLSDIDGRALYSSPWQSKAWIVLSISALLFLASLIFYITLLAKPKNTQA